MTSAPWSATSWRRSSGDVVGHDDGHAVALPAADHRKRDAGVAGRRLEDDRAGVQATVRLEVLDERARDAVLDRARRVGGLELGEQADVGAGREPGDLDRRRVADRLDDPCVAPRPCRHGRRHLSRPRSPAGAGSRRARRPAFKPAEVSDVSPVEVDVHEAMELALGREQLLREAPDAARRATGRRRRSSRPRPRSPLAVGLRAQDATAA